MYRLTLPLTDISLVLTPPLESLPGWLQIILAVLGLGASGALLIWLYSYEVRLVRPLTALGLLGLRAVVLALLWLVALQPGQWINAADHLIVQSAFGLARRGWRKEDVAAFGILLDPLIQLLVPANVRSQPEPARELELIHIFPLRIGD